MTEDPYRLDETELNLSATSELDDDEYAGLETELMDKPKSAIKPMPLILALMLVVFVSGAAYIAYQMFVADVGPITPTQAPMPMAQNAQPLPPGVVDPQQDGMMAPEDALAGIPPVDGEMPVGAETLPAGVDEAAVDAAGIPPVEENATAVEAEALAMPPADELTAEHDASASTTPVVPEGTDAAPPVEAAVEAPVAEEAPEEELVEDVNALPPALAESIQSAQQHSAEKGEMSGTLSAVDTKALPAAKTLTPIDVAAQAIPSIAPMVAAAKTTQKQADKTMTEVEKILGAAGIVEKPKPEYVPPVDVTPKARQVIVVKRVYDASSPQAAIAAGDRVLDAKQYGAAADIYDQQLKRNPSDPLALSGKALALQRAGNHVEAMNTYERLLSLNPRDVEAMTNYLGLLQEQDPQQAMSRLQNLSTQYPENAAVAGQLGMVSARMMDTPNALRAFQKAEALDPTNATYPFNIAVLYDRLGTVDKARTAYHKALNLARQYPNRATISIDAVRQRLTTLPN